MLKFFKKTINFQKKIAYMMLILCIMLVTMPTITNAGNTDTITLTVNGEYDYSMALEVLKLVNEERKKEELEELTFDADLFQVAMFRASETALYWDHVRPNGTMCYTAFPSGYYYAGENIALGQTSANDVMYSTYGWMNSPGHKANILSENFNSIGIGCCKVGGIYFWVQVFEYRTSFNSDNSKCNGKVKTSDKVEIKKDYLDLNLVVLGGKDEFEKGEENEVCVLNFIEYLKPYYPYEIDESDVKYSVDDKSIAKIEGNKFTMLKKGTTTLRANVNGIELTKEITCNTEDLAMGDVNGDKKINARDAKMVLQYYTKKIQLTEEQKQVADVNGDNKINARDAKLILQYYTKKISNF